MKICVVAPAFYPAVVYGGPIFSLWRSARALAALGHRVSVSTTDANGAGRLDVDTAGWMEMEPRLRVRYYRDTLIGRFSLPMMLNLWRDVRDADVVLADGLLALSTAEAALWAVVFRKPLLLTPRGMLGDWGLRHSGATRLKSLWLRVVIRPVARRVVWQATSEREFKDIERRFPKATIVTVPDDIDVSEFSEAQRLDPGEFASRFLGGRRLGEKRPTLVVSLGRLHPVKGFDVLIDAIELLSKQNHAVVLAVAGPDEGDRRRLETRVRERGVANRVFFVGPLSGRDKADFLASGDIFALASNHENFGIVYAEALAAGTPIVASVHAPWSAVEDVGCGRWTENTAEAFARAIREIVESDPVTMGKRGQEWVAREFDWRQVGATLAGHLENMADG